MPGEGPVGVRPSVGLTGDRLGNLKIVHVFRAPLGGLFRHALDLACEQALRGHQLGMFFDSGGMCGRVDDALSHIPGGLHLGVETAPIHRNPGPRDFLAFAKFCSWLDEIEPDVVHGHGSKGGVFARASRIAGHAPGAVRVYTPHGGSFHYKPGSVVHRAYMITERLLAPLTDLFLFESQYIEGRFNDEVGGETRFRRVVLNGLREAEFASVAPCADAGDLLYVGELREAKGIDTLLDALPIIARARGVAPRLVLVGSGPDRERLAERAEQLGDFAKVTFPGPMPIREAFRLGRVLLVPSRLESMPYVVIEAAGAGVPMVATGVGGIPEIFGPHRDRLGPPNDPKDLARRIIDVLDMPAEVRDRQAKDLSRYVAENFTIETMADSVMSGYQEAIARRRPVKVSMDRGAVIARSEATKQSG